MIQWHKERASASGWCTENETEDGAFEFYKIQHAPSSVSFSVFS